MALEMQNDTCEVGVIFRLLHRRIAYRNKEKSAFALFGEVDSVGQRGVSPVGFFSQLLT